MSLTLSILTPARKLIERDAVEEVFVPGVKGQLDILPNHANLVTELETGIVRWKAAGGSWRRATISTGILQIFGSEVTVVAEVSELAEEIDAGRAQAAKIKALKMLEEGGLDNDSFRKYELKLQRALARTMVTSSSAE